VVEAGLGQSYDGPVVVSSRGTNALDTGERKLAVRLVRGPATRFRTHIWPAHHENVHFYGTHSGDVDGELAQLDTDGYRRLRRAESRAPQR
jgi:hypothetical protein